jgi:transcriptional regulator with XRE-family HTH domain
LGIRLREIRQASDLTLEALIERSGVSARTIAYIAGGNGNPRLDIIEALAQALRVPVADLLADSVVTVEQAAAS